MQNFKRKKITYKKIYNIIVKKIIDENNITFKFLPAYTPEFNPIEEMINQVKNKFRYYDHSDIIIDIERSLLCVNSNNLNNYYDHIKQNILLYKNSTDLK